MTDKQLRLNDEHKTSLDRALVQTGIKEPKDFINEVEKPKITYGQNWTKYKSYQIEEKDLFLGLMCNMLEGFDIPDGRNNNKKGNQFANIRDIIKYCMIKTYETFSCNRVMSDIRACYRSGMIDNLYNPNIINSYMRKKEFRDILYKLLEFSSLPMSKSEVCFAVDSSGFTSKKYRRWSEDKFLHKASKIRVYRKAHIMSGTRTNIITACKITPYNGADSPQFKDLVYQTRKNFTIVEIYADKAYNSRANLQIAKNAGGKAYIPFKSNTKEASRGCIEWGEMFRLQENNPDFFFGKYHKRSRIESTFSQVKAKFLNWIRSKNEVAMNSEILLKFICHNLCVIIREMKEMS